MELCGNFRCGGTHHEAVDFSLHHPVRAGQEVFTKEIVKAGFRQIEEKKGLLDESYFVRFEKVADKAKKPENTSKPMRGT